MYKVKGTAYRVAFATVAALVLILLPGCDFARRLTGRPDSEALAEMRHCRDAFLQKQMLLKRKRTEDSLLLVRDSLLLDSLMRCSHVAVRKVSQLAARPKDALDSKYYLMMGYFRKEGNAARLGDTISSRGYAPLLISFSDGATAVALFPSEFVQTALDCRMMISGCDFFPEDSWIMYNDIE